MSLALLTILRLGLGSFHRAHQAVHLQRRTDAGDAGWQIAAGCIRADDQLLALETMP